MAWAQPHAAAAIAGGLRALGYREATVRRFPANRPLLVVLAVPAARR